MKSTRIQEPGFYVHREFTDVANFHGFWHLGQFAADYRKHFCELPSETLAAGGISRTPAGP